MSLERVGIGPLLVAACLAVACGDGASTEVRVELLFLEGQSPLDGVERLEVTLLTGEGVERLAPVDRPSGGSWTGLDVRQSLGSTSREGVRVRLDGVDALGQVVCSGETVPLPLAPGQPGRVRLLLQLVGTAGLAPGLGAGLSGHAAAYLSAGGVLVAGGAPRGDDARVYALDLFEPVALSPLPESRVSATGLAFGEGGALVLGGEASADSVLLYTPAADAWRSLSLPAAARGAWPRPPAATASDGAVLALLGDAVVRIEPGSAASAAVLALLDETEGATLSVLTDELAVVVASGSASAVGLDPRSGRLVELPPPPAGSRTGHSVATLPDGRLVLAGGEGAGGPIADVEVLAADGSSWSVLEGLLAGLARLDAEAAVLAGGALVLVGGLDPEGGEPLADALVLDVDGATAERIPLSRGRRGFTVTPLPWGAAAVVGGTDVSGAALDDVELILP